MAKMQKNYWTDMVLILSGIICVVTGYIFYFKVGGVREILQMVKSVHIYSAYVMTAALVLHVVYHFGWLRQVTKQIPAKKVPPKVERNYWLDIVLILSGLICVISGYLIDFRVGSREIIGIYKSFHIYSSYVMTAAMALHIGYHFRWLQQATKCSFSDAR